METPEKKATPDNQPEAPKVKSVVVQVRVPNKRIVLKKGTYKSVVTPASKALGRILEL